MSEKSAQAEGAGPEGEVLAQQFLQRADVEPPAGGPTPVQSGEQQPPAETLEPKTASGKILVDYGDGVQREVEVQELVDAHRGRAETAAAQAATKKLIEEGGLALKISQRLDELPPDRRGKIIELLEGPQESLANPNPRPPEPQNYDDVDRFADEVMGNLNNGNPEGAPQDGVHQALAQLTQVVTALVKDKEADEANKAHTSVLNRIDDKLRSFPVVQALEKTEEGKYALGLARQSIVSALTSDGAAELDNLVAGHAAKLNGFVGKMTTKAVAETIPNPAEGEFPVPGPRPKAEELTADQLTSGGLRRTLLERFGA